MKFTIHGHVTVSCFTTVEAETEETARAIAAERQLSDLCYSPFSDDDTQAWHLDTDGEPELDVAAGAQQR